MRERELKPGMGAAGGVPVQSLPMRERELKLGGAAHAGDLRGRSPCGSVN